MLKATRAKDELESRVAKRTATLTRTNEALQQEVAERKRAEEALQENVTALKSALEEIQTLKDQTTCPSGTRAAIKLSMSLLLLFVLGGRLPKQASSMSFTVHLERTGYSRLL
jgi:hypothetical protein